MELDSLTKDGSGAILVRSDIDFDNHSIFNAPDLGRNARHFLSGSRNHPRPGQLRGEPTLSPLRTSRLSQRRWIILVLGMGGGGELSITDDVDFGGFDALNIGEAELDSLSQGRLLGRSPLRASSSSPPPQIFTLQVTNKRT